MLNRMCATDISLVPQRDHRIDAGRFARRQPASKHRYARKRSRCGNEDERIARLHAEQLRFDEPAHAIRQRQSDREPDARTSAPLRAKSASRHFPASLRAPFGCRFRACAAPPRRPSRRRVPPRPAAQRASPGTPRKTSTTDRRTPCRPLASPAPSYRTPADSNRGRRQLPSRDWRARQDLVPCARRTSRFREPDPACTANKPWDEASRAHRQSCCPSRIPRSQCPDGSCPVSPRFAMCMPTGLRPPKNRRAIPSLTIATLGLVAVSLAVNSRPDSNGIPIVEK